jgi:hypothetical protein
MPEGFGVATGDVAAAGRSACELAEALRSAKSTWDGGTRDGADAVGFDVVADAYTAMQDAWFDEIGVHITILEQACEALGASAGQYQDAEDTATTGFESGGR